MNKQAEIPVGALFRGRYVVESVLGRGGFGTTYLVSDCNAFNRQCLLKELLPAHAGDPRAQELFEREARTLSRLNHPGIPRLEAFFADGGRYYLVETLVPGRTLAALLEEGGPLPEAEVIQVAEAVLDILRYLHEQTPPVVHGDIKPSNIMLTEAGDFALIDFGAVREVLHGTTQPPTELTGVGTPGYYPPEQHRGHVYPASDLYALGATLLHLLTGKPPRSWYNGREGRWAYEGGVAMSAGFARVLSHMLEESLAKRYSSARRVLEDLEQAVGNATAAVAGTSSAAERSIKSTNRQRWVRLRQKRPYAVIGGILAVGALLWVFSQGGGGMGSSGGTSGDAALSQPDAPGPSLSGSFSGSGLQFDLTQRGSSLEGRWFGSLFGRIIDGNVAGSIGVARNELPEVRLTLWSLGISGPVSCRGQTDYKVISVTCSGEGVRPLQVMVAR